MSEFISALLKQMCESLSMSVEFLEQDIATRLQRHYVQAGPWADMIREG